MLAYFESLAIMATFRIHGETSISVLMCFMITEVHCQSTKMLTIYVYIQCEIGYMCVHTVDKKRQKMGFEVSIVNVHQIL